MPLAWAAGQRATDLLDLSPDQVFCTVQTAEESGVLYDATFDPCFQASLVELTASGASLRGSNGSALAGSRTDNFDAACAQPGTAPSLVEVSTPPLGTPCDSGRLTLRFLHRADDGIHPSWEVGTFLAKQGKELPIAPVAGAVEYRPRGADPHSLAVLHCNVGHDTDCWQLTLDTLGDYCDRVLALPDQPAVPDVEPTTVSTSQPIPQLVDDLLGDYLDQAKVLGRRIAELHLALASDARQPAFASEGFSSLQHRSSYQTMRTLKMGTFDQLQHRLPKLPGSVQRLGREVLARNADLMEVFNRFLSQRLPLVRIRCHGDLHLGNILWTGKDFVIVNFQGAPHGSSVSERRLKRSPLWDVAALVRSFHYATQYVLFGHGKDAPHSQALVRRDDRARLRPWLRLWYRWITQQFVTSYEQTMPETASLLSSSPENKVLLDAFLAERALRELRYELQSRSNRIAVPLAGILEIIGVNIFTSEPAPQPADQVRASSSV